MNNQKVIVITGASKGIGKQFALSLAQKYQSNLTLVLGARSLHLLKDIQKQVKQFKTKCSILEIDVSKAKDNEMLVNTAIQKYGKITHLILNAGISMWCNFSETPKVSSIKKMMDINYHGPAFLLFYALPYLRKAKGHVIAISSFQGMVSLPKHSFYAASKHALHGLIQSIVLEEPQITFSKIILGWIRGTEIRSNRLFEEAQTKKTIKKTSSKNSIFASTPEYCSQKLLTLIEKPKYLQYIPAILKFGILFNYFFSGIVKKIILKIVKLEHQKH